MKKARRIRRLERLLMKDEIYGVKLTKKMRARIFDTADDLIFGKWIQI